MLNLYGEEGVKRILGEKMLQLNEVDSQIAVIDTMMKQAGIDQFDRLVNARSDRRRMSESLFTEVRVLRSALDNIQSGYARCVIKLMHSDVRCIGASIGHDMFEVLKETDTEELLSVISRETDLNACRVVEVFPLWKRRYRHLWHRSRLLTYLFYKKRGRRISIVTAYNVLDPHFEFLIDIRQLYLRVRFPVTAGFVRLGAAEIIVNLLRFLFQNLTTTLGGVVVSDNLNFFNEFDIFKYSDSSFRLYTLMSRGNHIDQDLWLSNKLFVPQSIVEEFFAIDCLEGERKFIKYDRGVISIGLCNHENDEVHALREGDEACLLNIPLHCLFPCIYISDRAYASLAMVFRRFDNRIVVDRYIIKLR